MVVPNGEKFHLPTLKFFEDNEVHAKRDVADFVADYLNLNAEELNEKTRGGDRFKYKDRSNWAVDHLYAATLLDKVSRGKFKISDEGLKVLNLNLENIDEDFLMQYDSYREYKKNRQVQSSEKKEDYGNIKEIRILPMSNKHSCCSTLEKTRDFLGNRIITQNNCRYYFESKINFIGDTLVLFQYDNGLIAKAIVTDMVEEENEEYTGYFILNQDSIVIFDKKITIGEFNKYFPLKQFSQVKRIIGLEYLDKINEMIDYYSSGDINSKSIDFISNEKRNLIYFGAPGTGKSYNLNKKVEDLLKDFPNNYERVTFHPDYSYANFVGTYKPVIKDNSKVFEYQPIPEGGNISYKPVQKEDSISYKFVPGPFMRLLVKALKNPQQPFVLIIEEINRANAAAVFGDVFQLLDRNKDTNISEFPIHSSEDMKKYLEDELSDIDDKSDLVGEQYEEIRIPQNMFIWATMNSADQGVFPMDTAFKRRWDFEYLGIDTGEEKIKNIIFDVPEDNAWDLKTNDLSWNDLRKEINKQLIGIGINEDKLIGPFFAFNEFISEKRTENIDKKCFGKFIEIFENKVLMYLYEDAAKHKRKDLFKNGNQLTFSQIRDNFEKGGPIIFCDSIKSKFIKDNGE